MGKKVGKYGKFKKKEDAAPLKKKSVQFDSDNEDMMNDEIDAFHKNRDVVPLNIHDDMEESDEDTELPVLDIEDDDSEEDDDIDDDEEDDDDEPQNALTKRIKTAQKSMRDKFGDVDDIMPEDDEEEEKKISDWGRKKSDLYGADVLYEPQSSDDEDAAEEEREVLKLQSEKSKVLSMADFGLDDDISDDPDREPTFEEILDHGKSSSKASIHKGAKDEEGMTYEVIKKDLNALTSEEQMDVVYSSAPELIGLLSELNDAVEELENKVNPLVEKIKGQESAKKGVLHYIEVKQLLLQSFCQAISFYLLLKSEGQPVRDHPVVSRLVEIKSLLDKINEIEDSLSLDMGDILKKYTTNAAAVVKSDPVEFDSFSNSQMPMVVSAEQQTVEPNVEAGLNTLKSPKIKESRQKHHDKQVGLQSMEMLKIRASLEEKLKQQGVYSSIVPKSGRAKENQQPVNRQLETLDDFVDEAMEIDAVANGRSNGDLSRSNKFSQQPKRKVISGDDDLPKRDDIGERRRKHELRVLAGAGINYGDDAENVEDETDNFSGDGAADSDGESGSGSDPDLELYKEVERQYAAKQAVKSAKYSRTPELPSLPETVDGKRFISNQIQKNRGLTRPRNKLTKNPRKKYKLKHAKQVKNRKGQVRDIRKPTGPSYGGEQHGINPGISRSVRF